MRIDDSCVQRRRFLGSMLGGGVVALGASGALPLLSYTGNLREEPPPDFVEVERADWDLPPGASTFIAYGRIPALIIKLPGAEAASEPSGRLEASLERLRVFDGFCTHGNCVVKYEPDKDRIFCNCHSGEFNLEGQVIAGPPPRPLRRFFFKPKGEKLVIALKEENLDKALEKENLDKA